MVMMDLSGAGEPDHGLIRDVLLNPEAYRDFLLDAYREAWEDGIITEDEMEELRSFQSALRSPTPRWRRSLRKPRTPLNPRVKVAKHPLSQAFRL